MAIEKALYTNGALPTADEIEVEIVNPDEVTISTDDMEINMDFEEQIPTDHNANLVDFMEQGELDRLGSELVNLYNADKNSRKDWETSYIKGLDLLGMRFEDRTTPGTEPAACFTLCSVKPLSGSNLKPLWRYSLLVVQPKHLSLAH